MWAFWKCHFNNSVKLNFWKFFSVYFEFLFLNSLFCHFHEVHCVESVQIRSFFWSLFSRIWTECGEIRSISRIQSECGKIRTRKNSVFGHFSRSDVWIKLNNLFQIIMLLFHSFIEMLTKTHFIGLCTCSRVQKADIK